MDQQVTVYDKTEVVETQLAELVASIKKICAFENIPFFISFATANNDEKTEYYNDGNMPGSIPVNLKDDNFRKYLLVLQGAYVTIQEEIGEEMQAYIEQNLTEDENALGPDE